MGAVVFPLTLEVSQPSLALCPSLFGGGGLAPSLPVLVSQLAQFGLASSLMVGPTGDCKVPHLISPSGSAEGEEKKC